MKLLSVNYHYFREEKPANGIYPINKTDLIKQIHALSNNYEFIGQDDLLNMEKLNKSKSYCILTFDDGLKEQMEAFELLKKKSIPAIFFVSTNTLVNYKVNLVHQLHYIRSKLSDEKLYENLKNLTSINDFNFDLNVLNKQYRYDNLQAQKIKYYLNFVLDIETKTNVINKLFKRLVDNEKLFSKKLYMDSEDIIKLANENCLGTHTHSHLPLATLPPKLIDKEINKSINILSDITKQKVKIVSYPYGGITAVNNETANIAQNNGLKIGFTMWRGINTNEDFKNPLLLKRVDTNDAPGGKNPIKNL